MSEMELRQFLLAVVMVLTAAHFTGYLFERFRLPRVIGEIAGGVIVGKTGLGSVAPETFNWLFHAFDGEDKLLSALYWMGLILLMLISGFSMDREVQRSDRRLIATLIVATTAFPFLAGWVATQIVDFTPFMGSAGNATALSLVVAIAVAITSVPVIARIFIDLGIASSRFARTVMSTAVSHDIVLWAAMAIATGLVSASGPTTTAIVFIVAKTVAFFVISLSIGPLILRRLSQARFNLVRRASPMGWILVVSFLLAALAGALEVNVVFGAFVAGLLFASVEDAALEQVKSRIRDFSFAFFIPFYFGMVGLRLDLINELNLGATLAFVAFCTVCQMTATTIGGRLTGLGWPISINYGFAMNARGGPGIVLATVALETHIINGVFYSTLVALAILTSLAAGIWFRYLAERGVDFDAGFKSSTPNR